MLLQFQCIHMCISSVKSRRYYFASPLVLTIFVSSSSEISEFWVKRFGEGIECRIELSNSLHNVQFVGLSVCSHLFKKESSLLMAKQGTHIQVWQNVIRSHFITFFLKNISIGFPLGP